MGSGELLARTESGGAYPTEGALHSLSWLAAVAAFVGAAVGFLIPGRGRRRIRCWKLAQLRQDEVEAASLSADDDVF